MAKTNVKVRLVGENGNVFNLLGVCTRALKKAGHGDLANELSEKVYTSKSYEEALSLMCEYCIVS